MDWYTFAAAVATSGFVTGASGFVFRSYLERKIELRFVKVREELVLEAGEEARRRSSLHDQQGEALRKLSAINIKARDFANGAVLDAERGRIRMFESKARALGELGVAVRDLIFDEVAVLPKDAFHFGLDLLNPLESFARCAPLDLPEGAAISDALRARLNALLSQIDKASWPLEDLVRQFFGSEAL